MKRKLTYCLTLLVAFSLIISSIVVIAAPIQAHERYGQVLENETDPVNDGYTLTSWIYGVKFGENTTYNGDGSFVIDTDGDDPTDTTCKYGGLNGDPISYRLEDNSGNIYYMNENDTFISGEFDGTNLTYQTTSQPDSTIKINELVLNPSDGGNQYVYLHAPSSFNLAYWRLENHNGFTSTLDSLYTQQAYGNLYVNLTSSSLLNSTQDELMLSWDPHGTGINGNNWVVMDRVEYGNQTTQPDNTTLKDYPLGSPIPQGQSLKRTTNGTDTNDCEADFSIQDATPRPSGGTENHPPAEPYNPSPQDNATGISLDPTLSVNVSDPDGDTMTVTFYNASDDSQIGQNTGVSNGTTSVTWGGLASNHTYQWYVESSDWEFTNNSETWSFNTTTAPEPNHPPDEPFDPDPQNGATGVSTSPTISVNVTDPDGDSMDVTFYNDTGTTPTVIGSDNNVANGTTASVTWSSLKQNQAYQWYAVANDSQLENTSSTWSFTTAAAPNTAPDEPTNPTPANASDNVITSPTLSVDVSDPDGDDMNVSFYNANTTTLIGEEMNVSDGGTASVTWSGLNTNQTYYWYAEADDGVDSTNSSVWHFTTMEGNHAPLSPVDPSPADGSSNVNLTPTLSVNVSDPDGDAMKVTFYDGNDSEIGNNTGVSNGTTSVTWSGLSPDTSYDWYAVANDSSAEATSTTWSFTTVSNRPPAEPTDPSPANESTRIGMSPTLSVDVSDPDGDNMTVEFYDASDDTIIETNEDVTNGSTSITWSALSDGNTYRWYVEAKDDYSTTRSAVWHFTTDHAPEQPTNESPEDGATGVALSKELSVKVIDMDNDDMNISFYNADNGSLIGTASGVSNGSRASMIWSGLSEGTDYSWYVEVTDGLLNSTSSTWTFTTLAQGNNAPSNPEDPQPSDGEKNVTLSPTLSVQVSDPDGDTLDVTFYDESTTEEIGTVSEVSSGSRVEVTWSGLSANETYEWYVSVDDGQMTTQSSTWSFTTVSEVSRGVDVTGPTERTEEETGKKTYSFTVENTGDSADTYKIEVESSEGSWDVSAANKVSVSAGESETVNVEVTIPSNAGNGDSSQITLTVTSENQTDISDSHSMDIQYQPSSTAPEFPIGISIVAAAVIALFISLAVYRKKKEGSS